MKRPRGVLPLLAIAALPLAAERLRPRVERCAMDGARVAATFRVRVVEPDGTELLFCGVTCAASWIGRRSAAPAEIRVTDCVSWREVAAGEASFVRTVANRSEGAPDGIRVFATRQDALRHAEAHGGTVLSDKDRPFSNVGEGRETKQR